MWIIRLIHAVVMQWHQHHNTDNDFSHADLLRVRLTFSLLLISSYPAQQQQMLLHCQMAYKAHCTTLILCVVSIKNWIEADKIRLCLSDLKKNVKASFRLSHNLLSLPASINLPSRCHVHSALIVLLCLLSFLDVILSEYWSFSFQQFDIVNSCEVL